MTGRLATIDIGTSMASTDGERSHAKTTAESQPPCPIASREKERS
jgi:hypothetical protein